MNPAFRYSDYLIWDHPSQSHRRTQIHFKRPKVTTVDTDQVAPSIQRSLQLLLVVHFAQHVEFQFPSPTGEEEQFLRRQTRDNQQNRISAIRTRLHNLPLI